LLKFPVFFTAERKWVSMEAVDPLSLPSKTEHSMVVYGNKLWLFGGYSGSQFTSSLYTFDLGEAELF
jgi:hypothetical protein